MSYINIIKTLIFLSGIFEWPEIHFNMLFTVWSVWGKKHTQPDQGHNFPCTEQDRHRPIYTKYFFFCWFCFSALLLMVQKKEKGGMIHTVKDWCHVITQFSIQI